MLKNINKIKTMVKDFFIDFGIFMISICIAEVIVACFKAGLFITLLLLAKWFVIYLMISLILFIINKIRNKFFK